MPESHLLIQTACQQAGTIKPATCGLCLTHTSCPLSGLAGPQPCQQAGTIIKPAQGLRLAHTFRQQSACQQAGTCICVNVDASTTSTSLGLRGGIRGGVAGQGMEAWPVKARVSGNVSVRAAPAPKAIQNQTANDPYPCSKHGSSGCSGTVVWIPTRR